MKTTLHLVRHGQTNWNLERRIQGQTNSQLTELGREQATTAGEQLSTIPFSAAYASTSHRAKDTAELILQHHALSLKLRDDMREIFLGDWEGHLYDDMRKQYPEPMRLFVEDPSQFSYGDAETFHQVQQRAMAVIEQLIEQHPGEDVLLVSHGIWIKTVLTAIEERAMELFWQPPKMENCSHSIIEIDNNIEFPLMSAKIKRYGGLDAW